MKKLTILGIVGALAAIMMVGCGEAAKENSQAELKPANPNEVNTELKGGKDDSGVKADTAPVDK